MVGTNIIDDTIDPGDFIHNPSTNLFQSGNKVSGPHVPTFGFGSHSAMGIHPVGRLAGSTLKSLDIAVNKA